MDKRPRGGSVAASRQPEALNGVERSGGSGMAARPGGAGYGFARCEGEDEAGALRAAV
jgi:hypothetical protein